MTEMHGSAVFSEDRVYRYRLEREWDTVLPKLAWMMLNPSTADAEQDDPTIRRCIGFARDWGYGGIVVVNVYALRATDPRELARYPDPVGPENDREIVDVMSSYVNVAAWGTKALGDDSVQMSRLLREKRSLFPAYCLGLTKGGHPRHPLYVRGDTTPILLVLPNAEPRAQEDENEHA